MGSLNDMLRIAQENSWLKDSKLHTGKAQTWRYSFALQYADDTFIFCEAIKNQPMILKVIFVSF